MTFLAASSTLKWVGGMSGSGTCLTVTTMSIVEKVSERLGDDFGNIADGEALLYVERAHAILEHRDAEWAGDRHPGSIGADRFLQAVVADAAAALFFHESARTAGSAAEASLAAA